MFFFFFNLYVNDILLFLFLCIHFGNKFNSFIHSFREFNSDSSRLMMIVFLGCWKTGKYSSQMNMHIQITIISVCDPLKRCTVSPASSGSSQTAGKPEALSTMLPSFFGNSAHSRSKMPTVVRWHGTQTLNLPAVRPPC